MMNRYLASLLALLFASLAVSSACFAEPTDQLTQMVRYDDLDLSTAKGMATLHRRIERAANQVCLDWTGPAPGGKVDANCAMNARKNAHRQSQDAASEQGQIDKTSPAPEIDTQTADRN
jgi:UrcA family protein